MLGGLGRATPKRCHLWALRVPSQPRSSGSLFTMKRCIAQAGQLGRGHEEGHYPKLPAFPMTPASPSQLSTPLTLGRRPQRALLKSLRKVRPTAQHVVSLVRGATRHARYLPPALALPSRTKDSLPANFLGSETGSRTPAKRSGEVGWWSEVLGAAPPTSAQEASASEVPRRD